jgi:pimeloyl-ACP methyl ester carboxylesterase
MTETDLVVVLPGITGSTLHQHGKPVWEPSAGAILNALRTFGRSLKDLKLPDGIGDDRPDDGVEPIAVMPDVHVIPGIWSPIHGYTGLLNRLQKWCETGVVGKVVPFPYDWRLSNRYNGQRLAGIVEDELGQWRESDPARREAQVVFICHSMGGMVARWYIEKCGGASVTRKLVTLGTPYRGAARAIDQLVNGVRKGIGPFAVDVTEFARSMPSSYQLLPDYACVDQGGTLHRLDQVTVSDLDTARLADALSFHSDLAQAEKNRPASEGSTHAIVGVRQPTATTVRMTQGGVEILDTIGSNNDYGDATVPLAGAIQQGLSAATPLVRRVVDTHGHLQDNKTAMDEIELVLTGRDVVYMGAERTPVSVYAPELVLQDESITVAVDIEPDSKGRIPAVQIELIPEQSMGGAKTGVQTRIPKIPNGHGEITFDPPSPGAYQVRISGKAPGTPVTPVTTTVLVWASDLTGPTSA